MLSATSVPLFGSVSLPKIFGTVAGLPGGWPVKISLLAAGGWFRPKFTPDTAVLPTVTLEAVMTWLDAGQPDPEHAPARVTAMVSAVIRAVSDDFSA